MTAAMWVIGSYVRYWQLCEWLAVMWVIDNYVSNWRLCEWLAALWVVGSYMSDWQLCEWLAVMWVIWQLCEWLAAIWVMAAMWVIGSYVWLAAMWVMAATCMWVIGSYVSDYVSYHFKWKVLIPINALIGIVDPNVQLFSNLIHEYIHYTLRYVTFHKDNTT